jgi:drug/metabolite transporter (DMT)-like permease
MRIKDLGALLLLAALWGSSFLFIRVASPVFGPFLLAALRVGIAGAALLVYAAVRRSMPSLRAQAKNYLIIGALNAAIPYALIGLAELHLTASLGVILNATTPLFTAIVAAFWLKDELDLKKGMGLILGVLGVAVIVGWSPLPVDRVILLSIGAALVAALSYGFAGVFSKVAFVGTPPLAVAIGQQIGAGALLFPVALPTAAIIAPPQRPSGGVALALIGLALLCTSLGYLLYFSLIASVGPTKTLSVTYLMPVFGIAWGALFLHERLHLGAVIGLAIILASVALVTGPRGRSTRQVIPASEVVADIAT